ncbi:GntR family transcriptional regulator [Rhodococcus sp. (in: high G+C Gram-positive bacteria)]|uniref:GntR family transcriptional regulator n=1 Tax=Rhodococcus sp. TaxID=1831 RepID=UPI00258092DB|nr:GntR family transcriptional regulator [Rhodococcus sp. (in: high G+C Gram-positive bacteria)]
MTGEDSSTGTHRVVWVVHELERMIATGELLPGQPIRQELMAETLGVSRLPIREGLRELASQGIVEHRHNVGYAVARLEQAEFDQIYLMRDALEREVLAELPVFDAIDLAVIRETADRVTVAADRADVLAMRLANQDFHFAMFDRSPLNLVVAELRRLWKLAMPYHAAYLYDSVARDTVIVEHEAMVDALVKHDNQRLVHLMDEHRRGGERSAGMLLRNTAQRTK